MGDGGARSVLTLLSCEVTGARGRAGYRVSSSSLTRNLSIVLAGGKLVVFVALRNAAGCKYMLAGIFAFTS